LRLLDRIAGSNQDCVDSESLCEPSVVR
jgi:hypothetical protein